MNPKTLAERFRVLDSARTSKVDRARLCASLTIPSVLPPENWTEEMALPQPYSSVASRGVTALASRILSALMPLNDTPFFKFKIKSGVEPPTEISGYLETLSFQVYNKLISKNLRESVYIALQHLIVAGDVLFCMEDNFSFRNYRLDQFVSSRDVLGDVKEIIHLEYIAIDPENELYYYGAESGIEYRRGYNTIYCQYLKQEDGTWYSRKENEKGELIEEGYYEILPLVHLRWYAIAGENYGRSHCEDILGDLTTLENYTQAMLEGMAAASAFWMGVDPTGVTEVDDIAAARNGSFIAARPNDVFTISPAQTINPQISSTSAAVENMRREVGQAFLMSSSAIPTGDRVTATAVRMIGSELETILGGAFSSISRTLMEPLVKRTLALMLKEEEIDPRLQEQFFDKDGTLSVEIITGLQALSRDTDLQKLIQMGEMVRNLPEQAVATFKWDSYAKALITSLGFDSRMWVKSEEEVQAEMLEMQNKQMQMQMRQQAANAMSQGAVDTASAAAASDIEQTGGQNIQAMLQQAGVNPQQLLGGLGG
jgi:hypothetical protein